MPGSHSLESLAEVVWGRLQARMFLKCPRTLLCSQGEEGWGRPCVPRVEESRCVSISTSSSCGTDAVCSRLPPRVAGQLRWRGGSLGGPYPPVVPALWSMVPAGRRGQPAAGEEREVGGPLTPEACPPTLRPSNPRSTHWK